MKIKYYNRIIQNMYTYFVKCKCCGEKIRPTQSVCNNCNEKQWLKNIKMNYIYLYKWKA